MELPHINHGYWLFLAFLLAGLSVFSSLSQGKRLPYVTSDVTEVSGKSFDYIVVGGGTAGCPLAATLSERYSVLLVERGGSPYENPLILDGKYIGSSLLQTDEFSSIAQQFIPQDGVVNYRGRVLGGSSAINFGFYSRASDDFVTRAGWDKKLVKDAFEWVESRIISKPNSLSNFQSAVKSGLLEAGIRPYNGFSWEHIPGTKVGGILFDHNGRRHFAADLLQSGNTSNIIVLLNATVKSIIFQSNGKGNESTVYGLRFIKSDGSTDQIYEAYLSQPENPGEQGDVILSAGAIGSPQILLLSGVGPKRHLKNFGIPVVLDLEGVGQEMQDNPRLNIISTNTEYQYPDIPQVVGITKDFKFIVEGVIAPSSFNASTTLIAGKITVIESKGKLELNNTDPRQNPLVEFNYLRSKKDEKKCVELAQLLEKVARTKFLTPFLGTAAENNSSPQELRKFCEKNVDTFYHYHGGCTVGSVVDNDYRVHGLKGLRVIDGSTFIDSPGTNPMATLLMLGRYQGFKILKEREYASAFTTQPHH